jgi:hypothetical protein
MAFIIILSFIVGAVVGEHEDKKVPPPSPTTIEIPRCCDGGA